MLDTFTIVFLRVITESMFIAPKIGFSNLFLDFKLLPLLCKNYRAGAAANSQLGGVPGEVSLRVSWPTLLAQ